MNLRELYSLYPLECESFGSEWLRRREAIIDLLQRDGFIEERSGRKHFVWTRGIQRPLHECLYRARLLHLIRRQPVRIVLLDGTIVREWGQR